MNERKGKETRRKKKYILFANRIVNERFANETKAKREKERID